MKRWNTILGAFALGLAFALPAAAQPGGACGDDIARLCADAPEGRRGVAVCLKQHRDEVSLECRLELEGRDWKRQQMQRMREACREDVAEHCAEIDSPGDRLACLRDLGAELSPECQEALPPE